MPRTINHIVYFAIIIFILFSGRYAVAQEHYHLLKKAVIGGEGGWDYLSIDAIRRHLFITHNTQVEVYDLEKDTVIAHIFHTEGPHGVAVASKEGHGFISCGKSNTVLMFDLNTFDTLKRIPVGEKPDAIIYDPTSKHLFVMNGKSQDISILDAVSGAVITTIKLQGAPEFAVSDNEGHVYVNLEDKSVVVKIDSKKNRFLASWKVSPGEEPNGIAMDHYSKTLFIACANEKLVTINTKNGKVVDVIKIGKGVDALVFDSAKGTVITSNGDGTATIITAGSEDWINAKVSETLPTAPRARTIALDPFTHSFYLVTAEFGPAPAPTAENPKPRPTILSGTFMVLKYGMK